MIAAAFFDEMLKMAEEDDWTPGENAARFASLGLQFGALGHTGKRLWDHRDEGFAAIDHVSPYASLGHAAGAALAFGAVYHRKERLEKEKAEKTKQETT